MVGLGGRATPQVHVQNHIDGRQVPAASGATLENWEPATGNVHGSLPDSDASDVAAAVQAAQRAFPSWAATAAPERARVLHRLAEGLRTRASELAHAESADTGKPLSLAAAMDIPRAVANFDFFADAASQFSSEAHAMEGRALNYTLRNPLGVVGCISPWNLPLYLLSWKVAPALAAGNCVVAKPSEVTPVTADWLGRLSAEAGLPKGVLNVVHGVGPKVGTALTSHPGVRGISFTGSTRTGAEIARTAGPAFKKLSLEMGGKNPTLVFADCDFDAALATTVRSAFANQGQICLCGSRILVEKSLYPRFRDALVQRTRALRLGDPLEKATDQGALVSRQHLDKVLSCLEVAGQEGARVLCGGRRAEVGGRCRGGWFVEPTLLEGLGPATRTNQDEIFGPVATLQPFDSDEEALALANATAYGLAASLWTSNLTRAHRVSARLQSGIVWVNCWMLRDLRTPFGGMKDSGVGREGGVESLRFFTEEQNVCIQL
jgi:aminomuconate-semialdehyde/2-hydroxymuconate-6-semialdehyde dehydrogenase